MAKTIICFDLDGTLVDTTDAQVEAFNLALEKNNLRRQSRETITSLFGIPADKIVKMIFPKTSNRKIQQVVLDKRDFIVKRTCRLVKQINNTKEALIALKKHYYLALNSNGLHDETLAIIKCAGIDKRLFDIIIGKDDVNHPKPSPDEIKEAEKKLHAKVEYVVGDTVYDIQAGKRANVKTIAVSCGMHDVTALAKENPDMIVENVGVLAEILLEKL